MVDFLTTRRHFMAGALGTACTTLPALLGGSAALAARRPSNTELDFTYYPRPSGPRGRCGRTTLLALQPKGGVATTTEERPVIYFFYSGMTNISIKIIMRNDASKIEYDIKTNQGMNVFLWPKDRALRQNVIENVLFKSSESDCPESMTVKLVGKSGKHEWLENIDTLLREYESKKTAETREKLKGIFNSNDLSEVSSIL